jgi:hypothetical protein
MHNHIALGAQSSGEQRAKAWFDDVITPAVDE